MYSFEWDENKIRSTKQNMALTLKNQAQYFMMREH